MLRYFSISLIALILLLAYTANWAYDIGYVGGYTQAILDDKIEIRCNFPPRGE